MSSAPTKLAHWFDVGVDHPCCRLALNSRALAAILLLGSYNAKVLRIVTPARSIAMALSRKMVLSACFPAFQNCQELLQICANFHSDRDSSN